MAELMTAVDNAGARSKKTDPSTDQGRLDVAAEPEARRTARTASIRDQEDLTKINKVVDTAIDAILDSVSATASKIGGKKAVLGIAGMALGLTACSPDLVPPYGADVGDGHPTATETSPVAAPTETSTPTATPEVLPAFMPEGFSIGSMGLMRNPETNEDAIVPNPEVDWGRFRKGFIEGLWKTNVAWAKFTGQSNDATKYNTAEEFYDAALKGEEFHIGILVRMDKGLLSEDAFIQRVGTLKMVDVKLDDIYLQALSPDSFTQYTNMGFFDKDQEAYSCSGSVSAAKAGSTACLFSVEHGHLVLSVGSFYRGETVTASRPYLVGDLNPILHEKYPTHFRNDGLGIQADGAISFLLGYMAVSLNNPEASLKTYRPTGNRYIDIIYTFGPNTFERYFLNNKLFMFKPP